MTWAGPAYFDDGVQDSTLLRCHPAQAAATFKTGHNVDPLASPSLAFSAIWCHTRKRDGLTLTT